MSQPLDRHHRYGIRPRAYAWFNIVSSGILQIRAAVAVTRMRATKDGLGIVNAGALSNQLRQNDQLGAGTVSATEARSGGRARRILRRCHPGSFRSLLI